MSKRSTRSTTNTERGNREKNYKLFIAHFHATGLTPIREKLVERMKDGLRRRVFIIDLDEEVKDFHKMIRQSRGKARGGSLEQPVDELVVALAAIEHRRQQYVNITKAIEAEEKFDIFRYWMENIVSVEASLMPDNAELGKKAPVTGKKPLKTIPEKVSKKAAKPAPLPENPQKALECPAILSRVHHKVGKGVQHSKRKYIEDEPQPSKLFIVMLLSTNASKLYTDLLRIGEPLQAIIHFIPERGPYDLLVPQPRNEKFLRHTIKDIKNSFDSLRIPQITKQVGLLQQPLPVISRCLAEKHAALIYDEMSWYFYDVELLQQHYQMYYVTPFKEVNVEMSHNVNIQTLIDTAESLTIQGHYLKAPLPAAATDLATIAIFLEGLLSTIELPPEVTAEGAKPLLRDSSLPGSASIATLRPSRENGFKSITKVRPFDRVVVEKTNTLFHSLVSFMNVEYFPAIYRSCLEYNILRRYISSSDVVDCARTNALEKEPFYLPKYCKLFLTHDSVIQRLTDLLTDYDHCEINTLLPGHMLYHFKRRYNEIMQQEKMVVLPSRLCFRDFTLFQLEEFLEHLVTPEQRKLIIESRQRESERERKKLQQFSIDINIFIRPPSLKAQRPHTLPFQRPTSAAPDTSQRKTKQDIIREPRTPSAFETYVGLPTGHPLLQGYNLEDVRQEVYMKSSVYNFEEGSLKLYEDRWCWDNLNKNIQLTMNQCKINFCRPRFWNQDALPGISRNIHIRTKNDVTCRILGLEEECAQIVLNYPNGLSVYFHTNYTEQVWSLQETPKNEFKRLMIPEGAVIVFYHTEDVIRVLRHNGEVYELLQYECISEEGEEEEGEEEEEDTTGKSTSLTLRKNSLRQGSLVTVNPTSNRASSAKASSTKASSTKGSSTKASSTKGSSTKGSSTKASSANARKQKAIHAIENELRFLDIVMAKYSISYVCLKVTTTVGRIIQLTHKGKVSEKRSLKNEEWHDYFVNESYAMRSDGVKIIWTKDAFKCFHADGTIITSGLGESLETLLWDDEDDISFSSSHLMEEELEEEDKIIRKRRLVRLRNNAYEKFVFNEQEEEHVPAEERYVCYQDEKFLIQHKCYAAVSFVVLQSFFFEGRCVMKIFAADNVGVQITLDDAEPSTMTELGKYDDDEEGSDEANKLLLCKSKDIIVDHDPPRGAGDADHTRNHGDPVHRDTHHPGGDGDHPGGDGDHPGGDGDRPGGDDDHASGESEQMLKTPKNTIRINIGNEVEVRVTDDTCRISAVVARYDKLCGKIRDILELGFQFDDDILSLFHDFVKTISKYKNYMNSENSTDFYFLRKDNSDCTSSQGFEFLKYLPTLGEYSWSASNTAIDLRAFNTVSEIMSNKYEWFAKAMKKFPRFQKRKVRAHTMGEVAGALTADFYCKIPCRLRNTEEIEKFLDPFSTTSFKRTRCHLKGVITYYLYPKERIKVNKLASKMSWRRRHVEHCRRLLIEMQRRGLYHAMLKHKMYPKYHEFVYDFQNHVSNIDFFDYVRYKCLPKNQPPPTKNHHQLHHPQPPKPTAVRFSK